MKTNGADIPYDYLLAPAVALFGLAWAVRRNKPGIDGQDQARDEKEN